MTTMEKNQILHQQLKKFLIKLHQEIYGKGPEEAWVTIHRNVATFYCSQSLTQLENFLLKIPDGENQVRGIRKIVADHVKPRVSSHIDMCYGIKVLGLTVDLSIPSNTIFGAILFEENIENIQEE